MDGMLINGTYIIVITRIVASASLVAVIIYMVPRYHKQVATVATAVVSAGAVALLGFVLVQEFRADFAIGPEGWYRYILDMLSIIFGAVFGAWMAYGSRRRRAPTPHHASNSRYPWRSQDSAPRKERSDVAAWSPPPLFTRFESTLIPRNKRGG